MRSRENLRRRLSGYWKMEALNVALAPFIAFYIAKPDDPLEIAAMAFVFAGVALLLVVGTLYWRGLLKRKLGDAAPLDRALRLADAAQPAARIWCWLAVAAAAALTIARGLSAPAIAACVGSLLMVLEYVNYYKVQLQHFDNGADFKRLIGGRGFRRAHLARDLAAYRGRQRS
jgi:hypothetical protein